MGGGGGGSKPKYQAPPPQAQPINYGSLMGSANAQAKVDYKAQLAAQIEAYPKLEALQLGTIDKVAGKLDSKSNAYTASATDLLNRAGDQVDKIGRIGDYTEELGYKAAEDLQGTGIEKELQRQAESDLALGRNLSPAEARAATQQARAGMSARGLGAGTGALAAEVLNRDAYATAREAARRNFAGQTNQMLVGNNQNRIATIGTILGQATNTRMNQANLASNVAGGNLMVDPYSRAIAPGSGLSSFTLGQSGNMIGNTYNTAVQTAGNVESFNANMAASNYNSYMNNNAALQGAYMQAGASRAAGNSAMTGSIIGGAGAAVGGAAMAAACCWIARAAFGTVTSRWTLYRRAMLRSASDRTIRLYCTHGPAIASRITTPLRRRLARIILCTLELAWK